jgi:PBP1b-binding outer membrane lipoprotein LpoB
MRRQTTLALTIILLAGCTSEVQPPFLNYQDCVKKTTAKYRAKGMPEIKAGLDARDDCREQYKR